MRREEYALLSVLAAVWGLSYVFYRVGAPLLGPALFVEFRVLLAGITLVGYVAARGEFSARWKRIRERGRDYWVLGALNAGIPFTLIAVGELTLPASFASVLNATAPLFSALLAVPLLGQTIGARQSGGIALGLLGVVIVVGAAPFALSTAVLVATALTLVAAFSYGLGAVYVRRRMRGVDPTDLSVGFLLTSIVLVAPFAAVELPSARFTLLGVEAVLGIALLSSALAYLIYFRLLQSAGPTSALSVTFLMPIFGVIWGFLLLGEALGIGLILGIGVILVGVGLVTTRVARRERAALPESLSTAQQSTNPEFETATK
jgi:drug/metabolite transporter (DMT)-like permease